MIESRSAFRNRLEWLFVCILLGPAILLPRRPALAAMRMLGDLAYCLLWSRRNRTRKLVEERLGVDATRARVVVRGAFRTMALNLIEPLLLHRTLTGNAQQDLVRFEGMEHAQALRAQGKGMILATAHLGAWECLAHVCRLGLAPVWAVARPLDNPLLDKLVERFRMSGLAGKLDKDGSGLKMARLFRKGEIVILVLDQNAGRKSVLIDFLGAPSRQHKVSGMMATRFGVPVLPTYLVREPDGLHYRFIIEAPIVADPALDGDAAEEDIVRRVSSSLEARVRELPEQWLWLHDRWRSARNTAIVEALYAQASEPTDGTAADSEADDGSAMGGTVSVPEGTNKA
jgi:KDO2-lipid IV(A) lauroyltransferase